jgi:hypothetical protein
LGNLENRSKPLKIEQADENQNEDEEEGEATQAAGPWGQAQGVQVVTS